MPSQKMIDALALAFPPGAYVVYERMLYEITEWSPQGLATLEDVCSEKPRNVRAEHAIEGFELVRRPQVPDTVEIDAVDAA